MIAGVVMVVFGILVLAHQAALSSIGAGIWAGTGGIVSGALGILAVLATSPGNPTSNFSASHLAATLISLALSNLAAIVSLTAVARDWDRSFGPEITVSFKIYY